MTQKIVIADTHVLCRDALCAYIRHANPSIMVECAESWDDLQDMFDNERLDVVLIDEDFSIEDDIGRYAKTALMVRHSHDGIVKNPDYYGIFPKYLSSKEILAGLQEILAGRTFFPSFKAMPVISVQMPSINEQGFDFGLTPRERDVLSYLVKGESNKGIARALDLQVVTVKLHVRGICRKLKASNRTQAALIAKESGWR